MALDKTDLEYIKNTIEWLNEHTVLIDDNRTNCEILYNSVQNSLQALESALAKKPDASENTLPIHGVSGSSFELIEQLLQNHLKAAGKLTRCDLDEQSEHELGLSIGRTKLAIKEFTNYR